MFVLLEFCELYTFFPPKKELFFTIFFFFCCFHVLYPNFFVKLQAIKNYIFWFVSPAGIFILLFISSCPSSVSSQTKLLTQVLHLRGVLLFGFREWPGVWHIVLHNFQVDGSTMACYACLIHGLQCMLCAALNDIYPFYLVITFVINSCRSIQTVMKSTRHQLEQELVLEDVSRIEDLPSYSLLRR